MCTSIFLVAKDMTHLLARTMDWPTLNVWPTFVPRGYAWRSAFNRHQYVNRYAVVGGGSAHHQHLDLSDGVNEHGLMAQKLTFANGAKLKEAIRADKTQLAPFEFIFWVLGNFSSVADVRAHLDEVELMADTYSAMKYGYPELHFALADATGAVVVIEPSAMPMHMRNNPLGVVTNSPRFEEQLQRLDQFVTFTPEFITGTVPLNAPKVTTGSLAGKQVPPGSHAPGGRFIRAAYMKERADQPQDEADALITAWRLLDNVTVPESSRHQQTYSVYRAATVAESRTYYYQAYHQTQTSRLQLTEAMLSWTEPKVYRMTDQPKLNQLNG